MRKIPTLFIRDPDTQFRYLTREVHPDCGWVTAGEGVATQKYDGTCMMFDGQSWWARREVKPGKAVPSYFRWLEEDEITNKVVGWEPVGQSSYAKYHEQALVHHQIEAWPAGTYELVGPKVNGNPERVDAHELWSHSGARVLDAPRDFDGLRDWLADFTGEGVVWHHTDGRMAKIKRRDFLETTERSAR